MMGEEDELLKFATNLQFIKMKESAGVSIKDFTDLTEIGHGAFGTVYKATYIKNKRTFALKRMKKSHLVKQNMITQINNEINISTKLTHKNIIKVYECFEDEEFIYLVLELAQNGQLYEKLKRVGRFDEMTAKKMIRQVVEAVQYLHSRDPVIIHRDIKPENLLLAKNDQIKLADFGWSNMLNKPTRKTFCGTTDYLAPEMIDKSGHDEKLDIWCIGVLVYELLTGRTPFISSDKPGQSKMVLDNILHVRIQFPSDFPTLAKDFVMGMIKRNPKERMTLSQIKNHPWFEKNNDTQIKLLKQAEPSQRISSTQKVQKKQNPSDDKKLIQQLSNKIRNLQDQNRLIRQKNEELSCNNKGTGQSNEVSRLMNQVRRLKVAEQANQKYKKNQQKLWSQINEKQKQIIRIKTDLKRAQDSKQQIQRLQTDKQKLQEDKKRLQKQLQQTRQKTKKIQIKLNELNSGFSQRAKNGQKITKEQMQTPEFMNFMKQQIEDLNEKFEQSKNVLNKVIQKQINSKIIVEEHTRLKIGQKKIKDTIRAELKQKFENQKDTILMKARKELVEEREKLIKQREAMKQIYEDGGNQANYSNEQGKNNKSEDLEGALLKLKELNSYYEATIKKQNNQIEDLKEERKYRK